MHDASAVERPTSGAVVSNRAASERKASQRASARSKALRAHDSSRAAVQGHATGAELAAGAHSGADSGSILRPDGAAVRELTSFLFFVAVIAMTFLV